MSSDPQVHQIITLSLQYFMFMHFNLFISILFIRNHLRRW